MGRKPLLVLTGTLLTSMALAGCQSSSAPRATGPTQFTAQGQGTVQNQKGVATAGGQIGATNGLITQTGGAPVASQNYQNPGGNQFQPALANKSNPPQSFNGVPQNPTPVTSPAMAPSPGFPAAQQIPIPSGPAMPTSSSLPSNPPVSSAGNSYPLPNAPVATSLPSQKSFSLPSGPDQYKSTTPPGSSGFSSGPGSTTGTTNVYPTQFDSGPNLPGSAPQIPMSPVPARQSYDLPIAPR